MAAKFGKTKKKEVNKYEKIYRKFLAQIGKCINLAKKNRNFVNV